MKDKAYYMQRFSITIIVTLGTTFTENGINKVQEGQLRLLDITNAIFS